MTDQQIVVYEIYDIWFAPFWRQPWFILLGWCILGITLLVISFFLARRAYRWWVKKSPWQRAHDALAHASTIEPCALQSQIRTTYETLDRVMRCYFSDHCGLGIKDLTESEMLEVLAQNTYLWPWARELTAFYQRVITAKYNTVHQVPLTYENLKIDIAALEEFIKSTKVVTRPL